MPQSDHTSGRHEVVDGVHVDAATGRGLDRHVAHVRLPTHLQLRDPLPHCPLEVLRCLLPNAPIVTVGVLLNVSCKSDKI